MTQRQLPIIEVGLAERIERILQRCGDRVKIGSVLFDERGEAHAKAVAERDQGAAGGLSTPSHRTGSQRP